VSRNDPQQERTASSRFLSLLVIHIRSKKFLEVWNREEENRFLSNFSLPTSHSSSLYPMLPYGYLSNVATRLPHASAWEHQPGVATRLEQQSHCDDPYEQSYLPANDPTPCESLPLLGRMVRKTQECRTKNRWWILHSGFAGTSMRRVDSKNIRKDSSSIFR